MNREQFLKALVKEGLVTYGTTYESNFKRIQELKKYKEMWEELYKNPEWLTTKAEMYNMQQKYSREPDWKDRFYELEEKFNERERELVKEIEYWKFRNYSGRNHGV